MNPCPTKVIGLGEIPAPVSSQWAVVSGYDPHPEYNFEPVNSEDAAEAKATFWGRLMIGLLSACFLVPGARALFSFLKQLFFGYDELSSLIAAGVKGLLFTVIGLAIAAVGYFGGKIDQHEKDIKQRYPNQPWKWRRTWASGSIHCDNKSSMLRLWFFALFWNGFSIPVAYIAVMTVLDSGDKLPLLMLIFTAAGLFILGMAIRATLRWFRFGRSIFHLGSPTGEIGGQLQGQIQLQTELKPLEAPELTLECVRRTNSRGDGDR